MALVHVGGDESKPLIKMNTPFLLSAYFSRVFRMPWQLVPFLRRRCRTSMVALVVSLVIAILSCELTAQAARLAELTKQIDELNRQTEIAVVDEPKVKKFVTVHESCN